MTAKKTNAKRTKKTIRLPLVTLSRKAQIEIARKMRAEDERKYGKRALYN